MCNRKIALTPFSNFIVIGAGAAGLAAARELARAGASVLLLEARERVGGRCWTRRMPGLPIPVELGAEFVHGEPQVTLSLLKAARIRAVPSVHEQRYLSNGRLRPIDAFDEAQRAVRGARVDADVSFDAFLARRRMPEKTRAFARMMVEGFDAADPKRVSARSIVEEWAGSSFGESQPRPAGGYGALCDWLAEDIVRRGVRLRLDAAVSGIRWQRGVVTVRTPRFDAKAAKVIVTLPLGVLQSGPLRFPQKRAALKRLASGPVIRVAMRFDTAFWEKRAPGVAFFHSPRALFPTFWTPLPMRAPLLTAWAGGPKAARLTGLSQRKLISAALASVETVFGRAPGLAGAYVQDWQADACSRGGYSYVLVGGDGAREDLAAPLDEIVFFAGEATDTEEAGTVAGALRSGIRAARQAIR
ncbi:MAG TPA: NAD(P)/FAD-dependent oxidoreductase [Burkholderiales bacterium]